MAALSGENSEPLVSDHHGRTVSRRRPTLAQIAARAGVSKGAASFALNGRSGVSDATRERVVAIAHELGWAGKSTARNDAARSDAIGLVLARPARLLSVEPYYMELISGIETVLADESLALLLKVVPVVDSLADIATYREWSSRRRVDGVIVTDVRVGDPRLGVLTELQMPAVVLGSSPDIQRGSPITTVWTDDDATLSTALRYLVGLGHRRLARVAGPANLAHCAARTSRFLALAQELDLPTPMVVQSDFSGDDGARLTRQLLLAPERPTAIMYENDVMAVAAVGAAQGVGVVVPEELSILAWYDSALCSLTHPAVSAMRCDIPGIGQQVARLLLDAIDGRPATSHLAPAAELVPRGSTAPARPSASS